MPQAPDQPVSAVYFFLETPTTTEQGRVGYFGLMRQSIASLKGAVPGARAILLTDRTTRVPEDTGFDAVLRQDLDARALVHSRLLALARALGDPPLEGDLLLLDPDTVVAHDFRDLYRAPFDLAFTSVLKRAIRTLWITLDELDMMWLPVERSWRLNERHYGALQGLDKAQTVARHGGSSLLS